MSVLCWLRWESREVQGAGAHGVKDCLACGRAWGCKVDVNDWCIGCKVSIADTGVGNACEVERNERVGVGLQAAEEAESNDN